MKKKILAVVCVIMLLTACSNNASNNTSDVIENEIKVGIIQFTEHIALDKAREGFISQLEEDGFIVDQSIVNVQGDISLIPTAAKKFESDGVDVIYAIATPAAQGAKNAVENTPIIFSAVTDPISAELVESNENPGENVTGVSDYFSLDTQVNNFLEYFPDVTTLGVLYSTGEVNSEAQIIELKEVTEKLGIELVEIGVTTTNDVAQAMTSLTNKIDAYIAITDNLASSSAHVIAEQLINAGIVSYASESGPVENGLLMSEGINYETLGREAGKIAQRIKAGESASDIPVVFSEESTKIINKTTAEELGISEDSKIYENAEVVE